MSLISTKSGSVAIKILNTRKYPQGSPFGCTHWLTLVAYSITFSASGQVNLTLDCNETSWQNTNWTLGQIYSTRNIDCDPVTLDLKPSQISAVA